MQTFERQKHLAHVLADDVFLHAQFLGRALDKGCALTVGLQVKRIDVKLVLPRHEHVHLHHFGAEILRQTPDAIAAVTARNGDLVAVHLDLRFGGEGNDGLWLDVFFFSRRIGFLIRRFAPLGAVQQHRQALRCGLYLQRVFVGVHPFRKQHAMRTDAELQQFFF